MPDPVSGIALGATVVGGAIQSKSAKKAANAQVQSNDAAIAEQRAAREQLERLLKPYTNAGIPALQGQLDLLGLGGGPATTDWTAYAQANPEVMQAYSRSGSAFGQVAYDPSTGTYRQMPGNGQSLEQFAENYYTTTGQQAGHDISQFRSGGDAAARQEAAVSAIEAQPMFQTLARQGEDAILQNASATGGLRGGNTQGALAQFRPSLLNQFINQQYQRLAGITALGQNSAAGVGAAGLDVAGGIGNIMMDSGAAQAGNALAQGSILSNGIGQLGGLIAGSVGGNPYASQQAAMAANPGIF